MSAGLLSFFSPCVLPLVPAYISYLTGSAIAEINSVNARLNLIVKAVGFVLGFTFVFVIMGATASSLGRLFTVNQNIIRKIGGGLIILFGLHTAGLFRIKLLYYEKRLIPFGSHQKRLGSFFLGMAFATGWTPCIGPILSSILIYAGSMDTIGRGILLLLLYSLGMAFPFILTAAAISSLSKCLMKFNKYLPVFSAISGALLIIMGILVFNGKLSVLSHYFNFIKIN
ncbi:MAG TPA: cytochrome c biogenesis protein CcdA [Ruminiclostridium sp.]|nr:cytochrome c biogenesis protein CcdA [Ruminiclostridium sp.]